MPSAATAKQYQYQHQHQYQYQHQNQYMLAPPYMQATRPRMPVPYMELDSLTSPGPAPRNQSIPPAATTQYQHIPAPRYTQATRPRMPVSDIGLDGMPADPAPYWASAARDERFKEKEKREMRNCRDPSLAQQNHSIQSRDDILREIMYKLERKRGAPDDGDDDDGYGDGGESHQRKKYLVKTAFKAAKYYLAQQLCLCRHVASKRATTNWLIRGFFP
ncbi:hypothetical protein B0T24DRAFT_669166 [Lasiosphaeria ovina]|uniref:Uncharacterized protein n=1 Tax=Lasiosphaeria ovina TaxID=92902 RepID=A0AAE0JYC1_9PEZI|nr:hypothetical protein B0T24DRAFT_669166 [Lasiosphaeria ovina]